MNRLRWRRPARIRAAIPTASMADIAFLMLIFFLTSTIFRLETGLEIDLPPAETGLRLPREGTVSVWMDREGRVAIDDALVPLESVASILEGKSRSAGGVVVSLKIDRETQLRTVQGLFDQLRAARIRNIALGSRAEGAGS